ncbi:MAG: hypothetical protein ACFHX7_06985 [Pseudomonadota bacterium]
MSLLLEALKRAALEKQARGEEGDGTQAPSASDTAATLEPWTEPEPGSPGGADDVPVPVNLDEPAVAATEADDQHQDEEELVWDEPVAAEDQWADSHEVDIETGSDTASTGDSFFAEIHETLAAASEADTEPPPVAPWADESRLEQAEAEGMPRQRGSEPPENEPPETVQAPDDTAHEPDATATTGTRAGSAGFTLLDDEEPPPQPGTAGPEPETRTAPGMDHARNRHALEQLLGSGRTIAQRTKRRENFLYTMLLVTALGGILSYYFYLLSNNRAGQAEKIVSTTLVQETPVAEPVVADLILEPADLDYAAQELEAVQFDESLPGTVAAPAVTLPEPAAVGQPVEPAAPLPVSRQAETREAPAREAPPRETPPRETPTRSSLPSSLVSTEAAPAATGSSPVRIAVRREPPRTEVSDAITAGYQAYRSGDLALAELEYARALARTPDNRDALLGAAAVAMAQGRPLVAMAHYQRRLAGDPNDRLARIGLLGVAQAESGNPRFRQELNALLREDPKSGPLHFMKGVSLASTGQWAAAQSAFYTAYQLDGTNADYAYNLAIALDHLNQRSEARRFYTLAMSLAPTSVASFSVENIRTRLAELDSTQ